MTRFAEAAFLLFAVSSLPGQEAALVPIDLYVNGQPMGNIDCRIADGSISAEKDKLVESLRPLLEGGRLRGLEVDAAPSGFVELAELSKFDVEARYDPGALRLDLTVGLGAQAARVLAVGTGPPANLVVERPADFSAYLNLRALVTLQAAAGEASPPASLPSQVLLQPVVNYRGWVMDVGTTSSLAPTASFSLDYARVSRDFPESSQRLTAGSLFAPVIGFMVSQPSYGVEFFQDPRLTQALLPPAPLPREFLLAQPSTVTILLNRSTLGAYSLDPGRFVIPNLQLEDGLNSFTVRSGDVLLQQVIPYDSRLLARGGMSYSANLGIPQWELVPPVFSAFFRYGFSPFLTAGVFTQDGLDGQMGGVEGTFATPIGNFHAQLGASSGAGLDLAAEADYRLSFRYETWYPVVGISAQYTGQRFSVPGPSAGPNPYAWVLTTSYSQPLPFQFGFGVGFGYLVGWAPNPDQLTATVTLARPVGGNASINCIVSCARQGSNPVQVTVTVMLSSVRDHARESVAASTSLDRPSASMDFRYQPSLLLPAGDLSLSKDGDTISGGAAAAWLAPFVDSSITTAFSPSAAGVTLSAGVAVVTAGGAFAVSRPVSDSFAILLPQDNMLGQTVIADRTSDSYAGIVTSQVNVGLSDLVAYTNRTVNLTSPTAPADSDLGPSVRVLRPSYKSGTVLRVGTRAAVFISGRLVSNGVPVSYRVGKLASASRSEAFFTDGDGSFQAYNLEPGTWTLSVDGIEAARDLTIPPDAAREFDVGTIALEATQ